MNDVGAMMWGMGSCSHSVTKTRMVWSVGGCPEEAKDVATPQKAEKQRESLQTDMVCVRGSSLAQSQPYLWAFQYKS